MNKKNKGKEIKEYKESWVIYINCQMPVEVMKNIVGVLPKNSVIVDPFMGSGTTGVACEELGYNFIGVEIDTEYFNIAKERLKNISVEKNHE